MQLLIAAWQLAVQHLDYIQTTIYKKDHETRPLHQAIIAGSTRQPWGNIDVSANWSQHLNDMSKSHMGVNGNASLRISRGLSLSVSYSFGSIYNTIVNPRLDVMGGFQAQV